MRRRILVIGTGSIGERHTRCFLQTGEAAVSICEVDPERRENVRRAYAIEHAFATLEEALERSFDAAVIATPAHLHVSMALRLLQHGLDLLIEKPLSTTLDGITELEAAAAKRRVAVAYVYRCHPALAAARQHLQSGALGHPVEIVVQSGQHFPTYRPAYREIYYTRRETGGGAIQDALTHLINAGEWLVGDVDRVAADASHQVLADVEVEDTVHVLTRQVYRSAAVLGSYSLNQHQAPNETTFTVVCDAGTLRVQMHKKRWAWIKTPDTPWVEQEVEIPDRDALFVHQARAFLAYLGEPTVKGLSGPPCSLREAAQTLRVNLAILRSADEQRWIRIGEDVPCHSTGRP